MAFLERVHEIPGGQQQLDEVAGRLYGLPYAGLDDEQANAVWDDIDSAEADEVTEAA